MPIGRYSSVHLAKLRQQIRKRLPGAWRIRTERQHPDIKKRFRVKHSQGGVTSVAGPVLHNRGTRWLAQRFAYDLLLACPARCSVIRAPDAVTLRIKRDVAAVLRPCRVTVAPRTKGESGDGVTSQIVQPNVPEALIYALYRHGLAIGRDGAPA